MQIEDKIPGKVVMAFARLPMTRAARRICSMREVQHSGARRLVITGLARCCRKNAVLMK